MTYNLFQWHHFFFYCCINIFQGGKPYWKLDGYHFNLLSSVCNKVIQVFYSHTNILNFKVVIEQFYTTKKIHSFQLEYYVSWFISLKQSYSHFKKHIQIQLNITRIVFDNFKLVNCTKRIIQMLMLCNYQYKSKLLIPKDHWL